MTETKPSEELNPSFLEGAVSGDVRQAISNIRDESDNLRIGNVLRRTCELAGQGACKQVCQLAGPASESTDSDVVVFADQARTDKLCADMNLETAFEDLGLKPQEVLMIGVTGNEVGFMDKIDDYEGVKDNPYGWRELAGFNAFFARKGESGVSGIGRRLADCADLNFEFKDSEGNTVFGFEHGTRTNMFGSSRYPYEINGEKMSFTEYTMRRVVEHYGADPKSMHIKLAAAIQARNFTKHFDGREKMDKHLPGWYEDGYLTNISNPDWQPGDPVSPEDTWEADTRGMILRDIKQAMESLGVPQANFSMDGIIDPGDSHGTHSSHQNADRYGDTRDLYITYINE